MTPAELAALQQTLADLRRKLKAREGMHGYTSNVRQLKERIADVQKQIDSG